MSNWSEDLRLPDGDVGSGEEPEDRGVQGISSSDSNLPTPIGRVVKLRLDDDETTEDVVLTIEALKTRRERLISEMLKVAGKISELDIAISLVAQVNIE